MNGVWDACQASWNAARRQADVRGAVLLTPAAYVGLMLATLGSTEKVREHLPSDEDSAYWRAVSDHLAHVEAEMRDMDVLSAVAMR